MPITLASQAMGTRFELVLDGDDDRRLRPAGEAALAEIDECHRRFNLFDPGSWLSTINRRAAQEAVRLDELTYDLFSMCLDVHRATGGAFDVTVAPLMKAWGLHAGGSQPDEDAIEAAREVVGMQHVRLDHQHKTVRFTRPGVTLDLGGIAKGYAIDQAVEVLREHGITCALLHGGTSSVAAIGAPPAPAPGSSTELGWRVSLKTDQAPADSPPLVVTLKDEAMSVSAPHGRTVESNNKTLGHVLDPRTGRSLPCGTFAAAVGRSACLTDAWATALLVLGDAPSTMPGSARAILPEHQEQPFTTEQPLEATPR